MFRAITFQRQNARGTLPTVKSDIHRSSAIIDRRRTREMGGGGISNPYSSKNSVYWIVTICKKNPTPWAIIFLNDSSFIPTWFSLPSSRLPWRLTKVNCSLIQLVPGIHRNSLIFIEHCGVKDILTTCYLLADVSYGVQIFSETCWRLVIHKELSEASLVRIMNRSPE